jgi:phosphate:Na+ symporter
MLLHCIGDLKRISDHAVNIMEKAKEKAEKGLSFSEKGDAELSVYTRTVRDIVEMSVKAFLNDDTEIACQVEPLEVFIDQMNDELKARHIDRLRSGDCSIEMGVILSDIAVNYERVADHCSNLADCLLRIHENAFK